MGYLIDSHCHLHDRQFFTEKQAEEMLARAREKGVQKIVCIGTDPDDSIAARDFASSHDDVYWTYGVHPEDSSRQSYFLDDHSHAWSFPQHFTQSSSRSSLASANAEPNFTRFGRGNVSKNDSGSSGIVSKKYDLPLAIGEVGLDYHNDGHNREGQIRLFEEMLQLATDNDLPVVFHVRNAFDDFFPVVANFPGIRGVVHSFTDSKKNLRRILETTDFYVGVNGLATYSTLPTPPLERILLETDAPFLTPEPFRGIINEPGYIKEIAQWLSQKLGLEFEIIERETTQNAERLYRFQDTRLADNVGK